MNTLCPKIGQDQWTCTPEECNCHLAKPYKDVKDLKTAVRRFFEILDSKELSDNFKEFHPTRISSCRTMHVMELDKLLPRMKELANED